VLYALIINGLSSGDHGLDRHLGNGGTVHYSDIEMEIPIFKLAVLLFVLLHFSILTQ